MLKNKKFGIWVLAMVVLVGVTGSWFFLKNQRGGDFRKVQGHESHERSVAEKYICPMHPQITSDKPGTCPICGMDLVLVSDLEHPKGKESEGEVSNVEEHASMGGHPEDHASVQFSFEKEQKIGIKTVLSEKRALFKTVRSPGRIAFDPELYTAQSEYLEALKQWKRVKDSPILDVRENTRQMINSSKIRLRVLGLSNEQIESLAKKGSQSEGLLVSGKGQENWVYADVFEMDLPYIKTGLSAQISANFLQGKTLPGRVISVDQVINPDTRTAKVRIQLQGSNDAIRPESYVNVTIFAPLGERLAVPLEAILDTGRETYVFVKTSEGKYEPRVVHIALETEEDAAIDRGISEGETVVFGGNFMLDSESRLRSVIQKSGSMSEHSH